MTKIIGFISALAFVGFAGSVQAQVNTMAKTKVIGIGVSIQTENGTHSIQALVPGAPAEKSGLIAVGDQILAVQSLPNLPWTLVTGKTIEELAPLIRGDLGTQVGLRLNRGNTTFDVMLTRAEFEFDDQNP